MPVENLKSTKVTNFETGTVDNGLVYGLGGFYRDTVTIVNTTTSVGSTYKVMPLPSSLVPNYITIRSGASPLTDAPNVSAGLFHYQTGTTAATAFATLLDIDDTGDHFAYNIGLGGITQTTEPRALWEIAGFTADPGGNFYILLTAAANNVLAGSIEIVLQANDEY